MIRNHQKSIGHYLDPIVIVDSPNYWPKKVLSWTQYLMFGPLDPFLNLNPNPQNLNP